jgi:hypothetical protein
MHVPINVKSSNNTSKWQMEFNSAFKGLNKKIHVLLLYCIEKHNTKVRVIVCPSCVVIVALDLAER